MGEEHSRMWEWTASQGRRVLLLTHWTNVCGFLSMVLTRDEFDPTPPLPSRNPLEISEDFSDCYGLTSGLERPVGQACAGQGPFKKNYLVQNIHRAKAEKPCCIWRISSFLVFPDGFFSVGKLLEGLSLLQLGTHTHMHTQFFSGSLESKLQTQCLMNPRYFCIYFLVLFFLAMPHDLWGLSSLTSDPTQAFWQWKHGVLTTGPPGNFLCIFSLHNKSTYNKFWKLILILFDHLIYRLFRLFCLFAGDVNLHHLVKIALLRSLYAVHYCFSFYV